MAPPALPPDLTVAQLHQGLAAFAAVVGSDWVLSAQEDRLAYADAYGLESPDQHAPAAAVAPASAEEVQALMRLANEHRIPLWPISRGKNYGYGGAAPCMSGTVILDLGRMRRILEVNVERGYCVVEPGVSFFDLHDHLTRNNLPLWVSSPGNGIGSVLGNALEHGLGYLTTGERATNTCGMEVVLPSGERVRTGMGAMTDSPCWNLYRYGYGPGWEQMFMQSSLGVVTQAGCWLMPEPEAALELKMEVAGEEDIGWVVETLGALRMRGVVQSPVNIGNFMRIVMASTQREQWYTGPGAMPEALLPQIMQKLGLGWWGVSVMLYGEPAVIQAQARVVEAAFARHTTQTFQEHLWRCGEPRPAVPAYGVPISFPLRIANWLSAEGGHLGFSPILPPDRDMVLEQHRHARRLFREHGFDYYGGFTVGERHVNAVNMLAYDRSDARMRGQAHVLFEALMRDARERHLGEYRSHLSYMDAVADTYDWGGHALRRLNEVAKDALDPNGILAPGKQGIWPRRYRHGRI
jgi:4-cresol dehydrogenase (hydroxylating) flavoprotein subunit